MKHKSKNNNNIDQALNLPLPLSTIIFYSSNFIPHIKAGKSTEYIDEFLPLQYQAYKFNIISCINQTIRNSGASLAIIKTLVKSKLSSEVLNLLLVAISFLLEEKIPIFTIINQSINSCKLNKTTFYASGLLNAVLRKIANNLAQFKQEYYSITYLPNWWINALKNNQKLDVEKYLKYSRQPAIMSLRINPQHISRKEYLKLLHNKEIKAQKFNFMHDNKNLSPYAIHLEKPIHIKDLPYFEQGYVSVQDIAAQITPHLINIKNNSKILDACAAPGGKILSCLEHYENLNLDVIIMDINSKRLNKVEKNLVRANLKTQHNIQLVVDDARVYEGLHKFNYIIADVPCSASGILRKYPEISFIRKKEDFTNLIILQKKILFNLLKLLENEGTLVYITCSIFEQEAIEHFINLDANIKILYKLQIQPEVEYDGFSYIVLQKNIQ